MMKFTGLILICATSALALLLPALGMVKFPMVALVNPSTTSSPPGGLPVAAPLATGLPGTGLPDGSQNLVNGLPIASPTSSENSENPSLLGPPWTRQKISLNAWLMLGPVMLLGLGLWTFAPNRGGSGR